MKVTRNTPRHLILADTPWLIGIGISFFILCFVGIGQLVMSQSVLGGLVFTLVGGGLGLGAFAAFVRRTQVILDRTGATVTLQRRSLFGARSTTYPLAKLTHAETERIRNKNRTRMYRAVLAFHGPAGTDYVPLMQSYATGRSAHKNVAAINDWLGVSDPAPGKSKDVAS